MAGLVDLEDLPPQRVGLRRQRRLDQPRRGVGGRLETGAGGRREHARRRPAEQLLRLAIGRPAARAGGQARSACRPRRTPRPERPPAPRAASPARPPRDRASPTATQPPRQPSTPTTRASPGELDRLLLASRPRPPPAPPAAPPPAAERRPGRDAELPREPVGGRTSRGGTAPSAAKPAAISCASCMVAAQAALARARAAGGEAVAQREHDRRRSAYGRVAIA